MTLPCLSPLPYFGVDLGQDRAYAAAMAAAANQAWQLGAPPKTDAAAAKRATELLEASLTPAQLEQFKANGWFDVVGGTTGMLYRIRHGKSHNVELMRDGKRVRTLCFYPGGNLPAADCMLAQKIAIECDEGSVLAIANFSTAEAR